MTDLKQAIESIQSIYQMLEDKESQDIYMNRLAFEISGENEYALAVINTYFQHKWPKGYTAFKSKYGANKVFAEVPKDHKFLLYGAGNDGKMLLPYAEKKEGFAGFCSSTKGKQENGYLGYPVMSPEELLSRKDLYVIIASTDARDELLGILENGGYPSELIIDGPAYYCTGGQVGETEQYFGPKFMKFSDEEVFVDAGCFDFRTSLALGRHCKHVKRVYAFEPDSENYKKCLKKAENRSWERFQDVRIFPCGVWSERTTLYFHALSTIASHISMEGEGATYTVPVMTIDEAIEPGDRVTMIKMDIEGSELEALKGARKTIRRDKPKLAICIYHKTEDLWEIPLYVKSLVPEYRLYIRHHFGTDITETVLYAVMPE